MKGQDKIAIKLLFYGLISYGYTQKLQNGKKQAPAFHVVESFHSTQVLKGGEISYMNMQK